MTSAETVIAGVTVLAILIGPFLGVFAQKLLEEVRSKKSSREDIFQVLMATRQARISAEHVHALNRIDLAFEDVQDVKQAWHDYRDHLNYPVPWHALSEADQARWDAAANELFSNLLYAISKSLRHKFDRKYLSSTAYRPQAYTWEEQYQQWLRRSVAELLTGRSALPIRVVEGSPEATEGKTDETQGPPPGGAPDAEG